MLVQFHQTADHLPNLKYESKREKSIEIKNTVTIVSFFKGRDKEKILFQIKKRNVRIELTSDGLDDRFQILS